MLEGIVAWELRDWPSAKTAFGHIAAGGDKYKRQAELALAAGMGGGE